MKSKEFWGGRTLLGIVPLCYGHVSPRIQEGVFSIICLRKLKPFYFWMHILGFGGYLVCFFLVLSLTAYLLKFFEFVRNSNWKGFCSILLLCTNCDVRTEFNLITFGYLLYIVVGTRWKLVYTPEVGHIFLAFKCFWTVPPVVAISHVWVIC